MTSQPLKPGDLAPDFTLPAADRDGVVALAQYRGHPGLVTHRAYGCRISSETRKRRR